MDPGRVDYLSGMGVYAVGYGLVRAVRLFAITAAFFDLTTQGANFVAALAVLAVASISFVASG